MTPPNPSFAARLWTRKTLWAIVFVAPSIFSTVAAWAVAMSVEADLKSVTEQRDARAADLRALDDVTRQLRTLQLFRAAFLVGLDANKAR